MSNYDPDSLDRWQRQLEAFAERIEPIVAGMFDYWTGYVLSGQNEPDGFYEQRKLWDSWLTRQEKTIIWQMIGLNPDDELPPGKRPAQKDVCALSAKIAERLIDAEVYNIN